MAKLTYSQPEDRLARKLLIQSLEYLTGRGELEKRYKDLLATKPTSSSIWMSLINSLELKLDYDATMLERIPKDGPVVFIANHPFGVVDGAVLGYVVSQLRANFKFLVNAALCRDEVLNQFFLPVDFKETKEALATNIQTRKEAIGAIEKGEALVIFPSGGVATSPKFWMKAEELEWKLFVVKLIQKSKATVVPIYFHGQNSRLFQFVSQVSMQLRLAFLLNEVRNKIGNTIRFQIGSPIPYEELAQIKDRRVVLDFLSDQVHSLSHQQVA